MAGHRWQYRRFRFVINTIINDIEHLPKGYAFWRNLPERKRFSVKRFWLVLMRDYVFYEELVNDLVVMELDGSGIPKSTLVHEWLVDLAFEGKEEELYKKWMYLKDKDDDER